MGDILKDESSSESVYGDDIPSGPPEGTLPEYEWDFDPKAAHEDVFQRELLDNAHPELIADGDSDQCNEWTTLSIGNVVVANLRCALERGHDIVGDEDYDPDSVDGMTLHEAYDEDQNMLATWATGVVFNAQFDSAPPS